MPQTEDYLYRPLRRANTFRLIELVGGEPGGPLHCRLLHSPLDDPPAYRALSYVWGDPSRTHQIDVEGKRLLITASLHSALSKCRGLRPDRTQLLWADALCINQIDTKERNTQVERMKDIYRQAEEVIVYLGEAADGSEEIASLCRKVSEAMRNVDHREGIPRSQYEDLGLAPYNDTLWETIPKFLSRPWFSRVWVMQEVALGEKVTVLCGDWECPWDTIYDGCSQRWDYELFPAGLPEAVGAIQLNMIHAIRQSRMDGKLFKIAELLLISRNADATEPRDKVYGILGLASESALLDLRPDYAKSVRGIYQKFTLACLEQGCGLILLYHTSMQPNNPDWPSWLPDFSARTILAQLGLAGAESRFNARVRAVFNASGPSRFTYNLRSSPDELATYGISVDTVDRVASDLGSCSQSSPTTDEMVSYFNKQVQELENFLTLTTKYDGSEMAEERIRKTLVCNQRFSETRNHKGEHINYFKAALQVARSKWREAPYIDEKTLEHGLCYIRYAFASRNLKKLCLSKKGLIGKVPQTAQPGDIIFIILGGPIPFVLRPKGGGYQIVGECYIHGIMKGEAMELPAKEIILV